ncbi:hypothetical protein HY631_00435 [Candidatus Uhrbacteria bacterium]|nr:hypothetical protein [Candidatus Uhrbacteria bacterium]
MDKTSTIPLPARKNSSFTAADEDMFLRTGIVACSGRTPLTPAAARVQRRLQAAWEASGRLSFLS